MEPRTVVAIEIASSKIKGAVGSVGSDGRLAVLAVEDAPAVNNVRYGRVQNIREVSEAIGDIIRKLEGAPAVAPRKIRGLVLSVGGRSIAAVPTTAALRFPRECEITESHVQRLIYEATHDYVGDHCIVDTLPKIFFVNNTSVKKAVGNFAETLRGEFMMVTCAKETRQNLERLKLENIDTEKVFYQPRHTALADFVLTPDEKEVGCAFVDFGAETSTVSVYRDGALCFLCTLPMGSRLITLDIMAGLGVTEEAAENYKMTLSTLADEPGTHVGVNITELNSYARVRAGEIAANILHQLDLSGYTDNISKIVLTGGGAKLPDFATMLGQQAKMPVRVTEMPADVTFRVPGRNNPDNIDVVALLWAGRKLPDPHCLTPDNMAPASVAATVAADPVAAAAAAVLAQAKAEEPADPEYEEEEEEVVEEAPRVRRRGADIDDDDILRDDEDDDDYHSNRGGEAAHNRSFLGFNKKKGKAKAEPEPEPEESEEYSDGYDENDEYGDDYGNDSATASPSKLKQAVETLKGKLVDFFSTPEDDEADDE